MERLLKPSKSISLHLHMSVPSHELVMRG